MRKIQKHSSDLFPTHETFFFVASAIEKVFFCYLKISFQLTPTHFISSSGFTTKISNFANCNRTFFLGNSRQLFTLLIFFGDVNNIKDTKKKLN